MSLCAVYTDCRINIAPAEKPIWHGHLKNVPILNLKIAVKIWVFASGSVEMNTVGGFEVLRK